MTDNEKKSLMNIKRIDRYFYNIDEETIDWED